MKLIHVRINAINCTAQDFSICILANRIHTAFNITTTELNKLCAVEGALVFHTVKHSLSYISHGCTIDMIKKCFPASSTVKNISVIELK